MQILSSLHPDDLLLHRDVRRFERKLKSDELQLQPDTIDRSQRGKLRAITSLRLANGQYYAAMMVGQQLFMMSKSAGTIQLSRFAQLADETPLENHGRISLDVWDQQQPSCCHFDRGSDPVYIYAGYAQSQPERMLLTSPLGGDDFWIINTVDSSDGVLAGLGADGCQWWWNAVEFKLISKQNGMPRITSFAEWIQQQVPDFVAEMSETSLPARLAVVHGNQPYIAWHKRVASVSYGRPREIAAFGSPIKWMIPSLPLTSPRLLVATEQELWLVPVSGDRPEKILQDEQFTTASFLPGGHVAAATSSELFLFKRGRQAMKLIDRQALQTSRVVSILSLTAEIFGILYEHGVMQRYRIS